MKRNFIHLPFNMLFYLIFKNSKNGVLYGLNKEHVNFNAHHETKCSHGVGPAASDHYRVTARVGRPSPGHWLEGGQASLAQLLAGACCAAHDGRSCPSVL